MPKESHPPPNTRVCTHAYTRLATGPFPKHVLLKIGHIAINVRCITGYFDAFVYCDKIVTVAVFITLHN